MITSRRNSLLKDIRRLGRCKGGDELLLEGPHLIAEATACGLELRTVLATPDFVAGAAGRRLLPRLPRRPLEIVPELLEEVTDSDSPRGIVATARLPRGGVERLPIRPDGVYLYAEGLQDPGNLGALARVAEASGVEGLALSPGCAHANHPRALRASAGSLLRLPVAVESSGGELAERLAQVAPRWLALVAHGVRNLFEQELTGALVLALGAEGPGLSSAIRERADLEVTIPLAPPVESLNATVAAAIALFEIRRRRTCAGARPGPE